MSGKNTNHEGAPMSGRRSREEPSFEFEAFAQSEADAAAAAQRDRASSEPNLAAPERRRILRRSYLPPGDVVVDARPVGNMTVVTLRGRINESFQGGELGRSLSGVVVFDLAEVDRVSSFGVKGWLQMLETSRMVTCYFYRCSEAIINQVTMMRNFCGPGRIHSLMVPYSCSHCGEEFGALYEAVADREALLGRSPAIVECPHCHLGAEMDDDPWSYFALDDHLLDSVPADLRQVIDHLNSTNRTDPIEKFISEAETRIRINAPLDGRLRLSRAFAGLEGRVTLDLSVTPSVDAAGVHRLVGALRDLDQDVTEIWLDGAPTDLIRSLLVDPVPRVYVSSMFVEARCVSNGITRAVLVDVDRRREVLRARRLPPVEANWAIGPLDIADTDVLFGAAMELAPPPMPLSTPPVLQSQHHLVAPPMPTQPPSPPSAGLMWQAAALTAFLSLLGAIVVLAAVFFIIVTRTDLLEFNPEEQAGEAAERAVTDGWDGGNTLAPAWVDQRFVTGDALVLFVGSASGGDVDETAERARIDALYELILNLRSSIASEPAGSGLLDLPPDTEPSTVVERFMEEVGSWASPERSKAAIKREGERLTVVTQHVVPRETWDRLVKHYGASREFRGLAVARRFPTDYGSEPHQSTSLVVTKAASWFADAAVHDGVIAVEGRQLTDPSDFVGASARAWQALEDGGKVTVDVFHGTQRAEVVFARQPKAPVARPRNSELLPLEVP